MNQPYDRGQLKRAARTALRQTQPRPWKITIVMMILSSVASSIISVMIPTSSYDIEALMQAIMGGNPYALSAAMQSNMGAYMTATIITSILSGLVASLFQAGYSAYALKVWRGQPTGYNDLFSMFPRALRIIGVSFLTGLFCMLWVMLAAIPTGVLIAVAYVLSSTGGALFAGLFGYIGIIALGIWAALRYAMAIYWLITDPSCGALEAIRRSKESMRGNKGRLLVLSLSFIGWGLLIVGVIYLGIMIGMVAGLSSGWGEAGILLGILGFGGLGFLATIPILLFLQAYSNTATMGFFDLVSGVVPEDQPAAPTPFIPDSYHQIPPQYTNQAPPSPQFPPQPNEGTDNDNWTLPKD